MMVIMVTETVVAAMAMTGATKTIMGAATASSCCSSQLWNHLLNSFPPSLLWQEVLDGQLNTSTSLRPQFQAHSWTRSGPVGSEPVGSRATGSKAAGSGVAGPGAGGSELAGSRLPGSRLAEYPSCWKKKLETEGRSLKTKTSLIRSGNSFDWPSFTTSQRSQADRVLK